MELSLSCCAEFGIPLDLGRCPWGIFWSCLKDAKPLVTFEGECRMALEPMQGNPASSQFDLWYTELFCFAAVTPGPLRVPLEM